MTLPLDRIDIVLRAGSLLCLLLILLMLIAILRNEKTIRAALNFLSDRYQELQARLDILDWLTKVNPYWCGNTRAHPQHEKENPPNSGVFWICVGGPPLRDQTREDDDGGEAIRPGTE